MRLTLSCSALGNFMTSMVCKSLPYNHAVWHLFVLAGSACQFFAFLFHLI